ncbi:hypothetical protein EK904_011460, partial [Melospiza melodia maxima]
MRPPTSTDSFSSRLLGQILQLSLVKYPLKLLQKASVWIGLVLPVGSIRNRLCPPSQSPSRPGLLHLLLSLTPTSIQNLLCRLPADWGHSSMSKASKASKRKRDDVALEQQESWIEVLERDLPEDDPEDFSYEPSELESDSEEYQTQNDTDLELEEQGEITELELPAVQGSVLPPELGAEDPDVASGDAQEPGGDGSSEQETDTTCDTSSSQDG